MLTLAYFSNVTLFPCLLNLHKFLGSDTASIQKGQNFLRHTNANARLSYEG